MSDDERKSAFWKMTAAGGVVLASLMSGECQNHSDNERLKAEVQKLQERVEHIEKRDK
jgi:outer membrane murein-binding lipoprotein Lpp